MAHTARAISILIGGLAILIGAQLPADATTVEPCISTAINASVNNFAPINGGTSTYCQSGFGWSDTWFPTAQPATYDAHLDVFSGDNAPSLKYTENGVIVGTGNNLNFLSPFLDGGQLNSRVIGGGATIITDIPAGPLAGAGSSLVSVGDVRIGITTNVLANNSVTELFTFTNTGSNQVTGLTFDDYFNFHPDGSSNNGIDQFCGQTSYNPTTGTVITVGQVGGGCSPVVAQGTMQGSRPADTWDLGNVGQITSCTGGVCVATPGVLADIIAGTFNNALGPTAFGDTGADLVWNLGNLAPGASTQFTITKNFTPISTPEPASLALLGTGLLGLAFLGRRRRKTGLPRSPDV